MRRVLRLVVVGVRTHVSYMSRSPIEITFAVLVPLVYATLAVYLFRAAGDPDRLLTASVGAGLMGIWGSVLFGSGGAVQNQRWLGTLETLVVAPAPLALVLLPITLAISSSAPTRWARRSSGAWSSSAVPARLRAPAALPARRARLRPRPRHDGAPPRRHLRPAAERQRPGQPAGHARLAAVRGPSFPSPCSPTGHSRCPGRCPPPGARAVHAATSGGDVITPLLTAAALGAGYALAAVLVLGRVERRARAAATLALA
ncbi:ABC transporter permease [Streptomyces narbonensis]